MNKVASKNELSSFHLWTDAFSLRTFAGTFLIMDSKTGSVTIWLILFFLLKCASCRRRCDCRNKTLHEGLKSNFLLTSWVLFDFLFVGNSGLFFKCDGTFLPLEFPITKDELYPVYTTLLPLVSLLHPPCWHVVIKQLTEYLRKPIKLISFFFKR